MRFNTRITINQDADESDLGGNRETTTLCNDPYVEMRGDFIYIQGKDISLSIKQSLVTKFIWERI